MGCPPFSKTDIPNSILIYCQCFQPVKLVCWFEAWHISKTLFIVYTSSPFSDFTLAAASSFLISEFSFFTLLSALTTFEDTFEAEKSKIQIIYNKAVVKITNDRSTLLNQKTCLPASLVLIQWTFFAALPALVVWTFLVRSTISSFLSSLNLMLVNPNNTAASKR